MDIKLFGDKILRKKCVPVTKQELADLRNFIEALVKRTVNNPETAGLAAPQLGVAKKIAVIGFKDNLYVLVNPKITKKSRQQSIREEGCLSFPGLAIEIKRPNEISVEFLDKDGQSQKLIAKNFLARVMQHEIDHLNGKLIIDYLGWFRRLKLKNKLLKLYKNRA
ncbi:MAG: peptide deformylase [Candidatus Portnoybacteria bacterium CG10_big_fil_rev_8_21_14_0_10_44_7]|uniref:Peptide deformylase n=1 Tax=Candidatus Portnoybacteria bacterium CG10_big_fil_rev_8_21_14_0_10_44_7 TaxID=1974816 RepID=A0A2M8KJ59_9BACT|nr:MAG: peptide deformylase [Candidatus Portnoybacteria bacterium CG10_big_fil_rev_8_21_14_0_10_44_7]